MNPLTGFTDFVEYANSPQQLRMRVVDILKQSDPIVLSDKYKNFVSDYFEPTDSNNLYWERFEQGVEKYYKTSVS
jgi:hypothetical protein